MTIKERNQDFFTRYHHLLAPLLTLLLAFAGIEGYGKVQEMQAVPIAAPVTTTVTIEAPAPAPAPVVDIKHTPYRSTANIQALIDASTARANIAHLCRYHGECQ